MSMVSRSTSLRVGFLLCNLTAFTAFCLATLYMKEFLKLEQDRNQDSRN
jgi:hypothetical protein